MDERGIKTMEGLIPPTLMFDDDITNKRLNASDVYSHPGIFRTVGRCRLKPSPLLSSTNAVFVT